MTHKDALKALAFAQQHDWGRNAQLVGEGVGGFYIEGLRDIWTDTDGTHEYIARVPATLKDVRAFGGY